MVHAHQGFLGVGKHTSATDLRAAKVARAYFARFHDLDFTHARGEEIDPTSGRSEPESVSLGNYDVRARGTLEGTTEGPIVPMLESLLGGGITTTTVGTTGKQHAIAAGQSLPTDARLSLERRYGTLATAEAINAVISQMRFDLTQSGYARWGFEAVGSSPERVDPATTATVPDVVSLLSQRVSTFSLGGETTAVVRNMNAELRRRVDEDDYDVTSQHRRDAEYGELEVMFQAEITFQSDKHLRQFWGGAAVTEPSATETYYAVNLKTERSDLIPGGTAKHTVEFDMPRVFLQAADAPLRGRDQVRQTVRGRAIYDSGSSKAVEAKVTNTVASY